MADLFTRYVDGNYTQPEGKVLIANRVFISSSTSDTDWAPTVPVGNAAPTPTATWRDVGSIHDSRVSIAIEEPEVIDVTTGLNRKLRGQIGRKAGKVTMNWKCVEFEPEIWTVISNRSLATVGSPSGGNRQHRIGLGGQVLISRSVLAVGQNAATGNEFQFYIRKGRIRYTIEEVDEFLAINVTVTALEYSPSWDTAINIAFEQFFMTQ